MFNGLPKFVAVMLSAFAHKHHTYPSPEHVTFIAQQYEAAQRRAYAEWWNRRTASMGSDGATLAGSLYQFSV